MATARSRYRRYQIQTCKSNSEFFFGLEYFQRLTPESEGSPGIKASNKMLKIDLREVGR